MSPKNGASRDWGLVVRMVATLCLSLAVTALLGVALARALVLLLGTEAGLALFVAVVGLLVAAQVIVGGPLELRLTPVHERSSEEAAELSAVVGRVARQLDLPMPTVAIEDSSVPNAYTVGVLPNRSRLVVTRGLVALLSTDELEAVVAHEMAHVKNRDGAVMTVAAVGAVLAGRGASITKAHLEPNSRAGRTNRRRNANGVDIVVAAFHVFFTASWFVSYLLVSALTRYREYAADRAAARITGSPAVVATALRKLDGVEASPTRDLRSRHSSIQEFCIVPEERSSDGDDPFAFELDSYHPRTSRFATEWPLVARLTRTHPPVEARVERLRALEGAVTS
ncbi:M48 family metalloprotease [Haladaptatus salinisoli]|uniref:M48 family metalloprotease n=1 Tax=Haladaptatus salinisoli TaxID=2884876 RepID=UPI001D0A83DF|nr:M48 family metalloprotease [Haladaptatus salinisoli]